MTKNYVRKNYIWQHKVNIGLEDPEEYRETAQEFSLALLREYTETKNMAEDLGNPKAGMSLMWFANNALKKVMLSKKKEKQLFWGEGELVHEIVQKSYLP